MLKITTHKLFKKAFQVSFLRVSFKPLKNYNGTAFAVPLVLQEQPSPINELNGTPPKVACPITNLHRFKPLKISFTPINKDKKTSIYDEYIHQFNPFYITNNNLYKFLSSIPKNNTQKIEIDIIKKIISTNYKSSCNQPTMEESTRERKEVQYHGFIWEKELLEIYGVTTEDLKQIKYTSKMDIPSNFNRINNCDISIKVTGNKNMVCMADCLRIYDAVSSDKPMHMIVVYYNQDNDNKTKQLVNIMEIDLTNSRELLFGNITRAQIEDLDNAVKAVPQKRKPTQEEYSKMYSIRDALQSQCGAIHLDIKCNSTQSRLQCSFNHFQEFIEKKPEKVIEKSETNEFRGGKISPEIASSRRVFKKKQPLV